MGLRTFLKQKAKLILARLDEWPRSGREAAKAEKSIFPNDSINGSSTNHVTAKIRSFTDKDEVQPPKDLNEEVEKRFQKPIGSRLATIIVMNGEIVEKVYITSKGQKISSKPKKP